MAAPWGRLLAIGAREADAYRRVSLLTPEVTIGRREGCPERLTDNTVSSVHCRITLTHAPAPESDESPDEDAQPLEVWLEDASANGTYVNAEKVGKGNRVRLSQNDEIGLIKPCGGAERQREWRREHTPCSLPWLLMYCRLNSLDIQR